MAMILEQRQLGVGDLSVLFLKGWWGRNKVSSSTLNFRPYRLLAQGVAFEGISKSQKRTGDEEKWECSLGIYVLENNDARSIRSKDSPLRLSTLKLLLHKCWLEERWFFFFYLTRSEPSIEVPLKSQMVAATSESQNWEILHTSRAWHGASQLIKPLGSWHKALLLTKPPPYH